SKNLNKLELNDLFEDLKAHEFEMSVREEAPTSLKSSKALMANLENKASVSGALSNEELAKMINTVMVFFTEQFGKHEEV
ncbi:hypothetical protein, partial [Serratia marcescens]|uniref:hypothetical protein n=1 Tax=Serratia marcescens TaxID=615 RepID=UPI002813A35C